MNQQQRLHEIKKLLRQKHQLSTRELADHFKVAFDTARRDIVRLTQTGQAVRVHGGLMEINRNQVPAYLLRKEIQSPIKLRMAEKAKRFVHPGDCDFINSSTTLRQMCNLLGETEVQIVTNSIDCALALISVSLPRVRLLGGVINKNNRFIYSKAALDTINKLHFNTAFLGASKVRSDGAYGAQSEDAEIAQAVIERAQQVVLVAEKYKFTNQNVSPFLEIPIDKIDVLITDTPLSDQEKAFFNSNTQIISV